MPKIASEPADAGSDTSVDAGAADTSVAGFVWSTRRPLPVPRTDHGAGAIHGKVYAFGGYSGSVLARTDEYDPATDTWTRKADMPEPRRGFASAVIGGKIYVAGGMTYTLPNDVTYYTSTVIYDPVADAWTSGAPCPLSAPPNQVYGNLFVGGGEMGGLFYLFETSSGLSNMHIYDPSTDKWTMKAGGAFTWSIPQAVSLVDVLYVFASTYGPGQQVGSLWGWYSSSDTWVIRQSLPNASRSAFFAMNGKVYAASGIVGDSGTFTLTPAIWEYDPLVEAWSQRGALNVAREWARAAVIGSSVYVVGGEVLSVPSAVVEVGVLQ